VTLSLALAAAVALGEPSSVRAVRVTSLDFRTAVRVLSTEDVPAGTVAREGDEVVIRVPAPPEEAALVAPPAERPLAEVRIEAAEGATVVRVRVAPEVPFESTHEPGMLTVVFGEQPAPELRGPVTPELYTQLFPTGPIAGAADEGEAEEGARPAEEGVGGILVGPLALRPFVTASFVDADVIVSDELEPVRDQYLQVAPGLGVSLPLLGGLLSADYEARMRFFSDIPEVDTTSHLAAARLELPLGSRATARLQHRFTRATLETSIVDPGREYFYDLAPYTLNETTLGARLDLGPRLFGEGDLSLRSSSFDEGASGFFGYDSRTARAGLGYDLGGDRSLLASYRYESIPAPPDREIVETTAHSVDLTLRGQLGPLMEGSLSAGLRSQDSPLAGAGSESYTGLVLGGTLRRQLGHSSSLDVALNRSTEPSFFEENAFYVTNSAVLGLTVPAPFETWARGSVALFQNDYPTDAAGIGEPRRDRILGWTVGVGRSLSWRAWVRADYRRERRTSNVPGFDVTTSGFIVQVGLGHYGTGAARP
jgi:hypothetical protein